MKTVEITTTRPSSPVDAPLETPGENPTLSLNEGSGPVLPHYLVVLHFQDGRSADLVVPGVTGMGGGGDTPGPGRLNIYGPAEERPLAARRLLGARLFNDLADLTFVPEPLELEIDEVAESGP